MNRNDAGSASHITAPTWDVPAKYGEASAYHDMGSVAAPLLAGFSLTFLGFAIQGEDKLRWPSLTILLLTSATVLFILTVQCTFWARLYGFTPSEAKEWWPDFDDPQRLERIREEQWSYRILYRRWSLRARRTYGSAVVILYSAVAIALVPNQALRSIAIARLIAVLIAAGAAVIELLWFWATWILSPNRGAWIERMTPLLTLAEFLFPNPPWMRPPSVHHNDEE